MSLFTLCLLRPVTFFLHQNTWDELLIVYPLLQRVGTAGAARHQQQERRSTIRSTARADSTNPAKTILGFSSPTTATAWHRHHPCCRLNRRAALSLSYGLETARHVLAKQLYSHHSASSSGTLHNNSGSSKSVVAHKCRGPHAWTPPWAAPWQRQMASTLGVSTLLPRKSSSKSFLSKVALNDFPGKRQLLA